MKNNDPFNAGGNKGFNPFEESVNKTFDAKNTELRSDYEANDPDNSPFKEDFVSEPQEAVYAQNKPFFPWLQRIWGVVIIISFFILQTVSGLIAVGIIKSDVAATSLEQIEIGNVLADMFLGMLIGEIVFIAVLVMIYNRRIWGKIKQALSKPGQFIGKIVLYYFLMYGTIIVLGIIDAMLFPGLLEEAGSNQESIELALTSAPSLAMLISICITAPIVEEYVFRYGIMSKLLYGLNKYVAAVIAALIFSFVHIGFSQAANPAMLIHLLLGYMGQALVFSIIYAREENLLYSITLHAINNIQAVIIIIAITT